MTKIIQEDQVRGGLIDLPPLETFNLPQAVLKVAQEIADCDGIGIETSSFDLLVRLIAYWSRMSLPAQEFKLDWYAELARISPQIPGMDDENLKVVFLSPANAKQRFIQEAKDILDKQEQEKDSRVAQLVADNEALKNKFAKLNNVVNFFLGFIKILSEQKLTKEMDADKEKQADYEGAHNIIVEDAREYLRVYRIYYEMDETRIKITTNVIMTACDAYLCEIKSSQDHVKAIRAALESADAIISLGTIPKGVIVTQDLLRSMLSDTKTKD